MTNELKMVLAAGMLATGLVACSNDADIASRNISQAADNFGINRRVVFYNGITGDYPTPADTPTMHYVLSKTSSDMNYNLTIERTADVSDVVSGDNNTRIARSLEKGAPWLIANRGLNPASCTDPGDRERLPR